VLTDLITEYDDIVSYSVKGRSRDVPPWMEFTLDGKNWESSGNRMASPQISIEKQITLKTLIDELLDKEVIRPSKATRSPWSQVRKPSGGAFYYGLQSAKQGDNKRGTENTQYEGHVAVHRTLKATRFRGDGPYPRILPNASA